MTKQLKVALTLFLFTWLTSNVALAETFKTNISGVVLKKVRCDSGYWLKGNLVNRTNQSLKGKQLHFIVFDEDNDPIGNCKIYSLTVGPKSGDNFEASDCNCGGRSFSFSARIQ